MNGAGGGCETEAFEAEGCEGDVEAGAARDNEEDEVSSKVVMTVVLVPVLVTLDTDKPCLA